MRKNIPALFVLSALLLAGIAPLFAQGEAPPKTAFAACTQSAVPEDKMAFVDGLLGQNGLSISNFSGNGLETQIYSVLRETCPGGDVVNAYFRQSYNGIAILNYEAMAHFRDGTMEGNCYFISSSERAKSACDNALFVDFPSAAGEPAISEARGREIAAQIFAGWGMNESDYDSMLVYWVGTYDGQPRLAWAFGKKVDLQYRPRPFDASIVVDAVDGTVLFEDSGIRYGGTQEIGQIAQPPMPEETAREIEQRAADANGQVFGPGAQKTLAASPEEQKAEKPFPLAEFAPLIAVFAIALAIITVLMFRPPAPEHAEMARMLVNETRLGILNELVQSEKIPTDLSNRLGKSKATIVEHLDKLIDAGLVERVSSPGKKFVFYRLTPKGRSWLYRQAG